MPTTPIHSHTHAHGHGHGRAKVHGSLSGLSPGLSLLMLCDGTSRVLRIWGILLAWTGIRAADIVAIALVYFVQGVLGLARLAVSFFLKDEFGLDPAETALLSGFSTLPWLIKPLYGFLSDGFPLFGSRRRSYLILCGFVGASAWALLATIVHDKYSTVAMILLSSLSVAVSDVVVDSLVVERARGEDQSMAGSLQSLCWGSSAVGGIVSAYWSGSLVELYGTRFVFAVTAVLPLITSIAGIFTKSSFSLSPPPTWPTRIIITSTNKLGFGPEFLGRVRLVTSVASLLEVSQKSSFSLSPPPTWPTRIIITSTNKLGFGPEFLGRVRLVTSVASLVGVGVYNFWLKHVPLHRIFLWINLLGTALGCTQVRVLVLGLGVMGGGEWGLGGGKREGSVGVGRLVGRWEGSGGQVRWVAEGFEGGEELLLVTGVNRTLGISDHYFALGDSLILTVLGQVSFMPILVLAARLCPPGIEATLFATLMSVNNGAYVVSGLLGAALTEVLGVTSTNFDNLALLVLICNLSSLLALPFLRLLPSLEEVEAAVARLQEDIEAGKEA
ncbi:unnamed protein product [Closterium sp. Yama58-4]|nr:unnamed protein product [Closterium sp. Yama58-4]